MAVFSPDIAAAVVASIGASVAELGAALDRAFDGPFVVEPAASSVFDLAHRAGDLSGPGLVIAMLAQEVAVAVILAESTELLPEWYKNPDATGESRLMTLAQELGMLLLPKEEIPEGFRAGRVNDIAVALGQSSFPPEAVVIPLPIAVGDKKGTLHLIWPARDPGLLFGQKPAAKGKGAEDLPLETESEPAEIDPFRQLPPYMQSLLRISLPVRVRLASKRQPAQEVLRLGPGVIIQFEKSCDEMLDFLVGRERVATGEAVKVGDKFGLRVTSIASPEERFRRVGRRDS